MAERQRPSEQFGREAVKLWRSAGMTIDALADAIGKSKAQVERLQRGEGSMEVGILVKTALTKKKIDLSTLPPLDPTEADSRPAPSTIAPDAPFSEEEWARIGYLLNKHASKTLHERFLPELRDVASACEALEQRLAKFSNPK